jgi:hypothetical protein
MVILERIVKTVQECVSFEGRLLMTDARGYWCAHGVIFGGKVYILGDICG